MRGSTPCRTSATYVRLEVTDAQGRKAWSNPLYLR